MHACRGSGRRLIGTHPEHALCRLDLVTCAPPRDEGTRERSVEETDRHRVVEHPARSGRGHRPAICAAILVEPGSHVGMPLAETFCWNAYPDSDREASLGHRDHVAWVTRHPSFLFCSELGWRRHLAVSSRLGLPPSKDMLAPCVAASGSPPMSARSSSSSRSHRIGRPQFRALLKLLANLKESEPHGDRYQRNRPD
jgi:hypothetical protein